MKTLHHLALLVVVVTAVLSCAPIALGQSVTYEGYGGVTTGGAGGDVYHVTSLADSGPGTLRDGVTNRTGARTIVFDVAGTIVLRSDLIINRPYLTINGASAPAPGITIGQNTIFDKLILAGTHDIVINHLRFWGLYVAGGPLSNNASIVGIDGDSGPDFVAQRIILDHITVRGATDGGPDIWGEVRDVTFSWSFIFYNFHPTTISHDGAQIRQRISMHHNVYAKNSERNPQLRADVRNFDYVNNIVYDWGFFEGWGYGIRVRNDAGEPKVNGNFVNNALIPGLINPEWGLVYGTDPGPDSTDGGPSGSPPQGTVVTTSKMGSLWVSGNILPSGNRDQYSTISAPLPVPASARVTTWPAAELGTRVLPSVGMKYRTVEEQAILDEIASELTTPSTAGLTVGSVTPNPGVQGAVMPVTVTGTGFGAGATVSFGSGITVSNVMVASGTQLAATLTIGSAATVGPRDVTVMNPDAVVGTRSGGFTVNAPPPVPTLTTISPTTVGVGGSSFTLTANGTGFTSTSVLQVNGVARPTVFVSATRLTATIPAQDISIAAALSISVVTPAPGGGTSGTRTLTVTSPTITVNATSVPSGGSMTATLNNGPGGSTDWLGLSLVGAPNTSYLQWVYVGTGLTTRTWTPTLPTVPGTYEVRLYLNNGYTIAARSPLITVNPSTATITVSATTAPAGGSITATLTNSPGGATDWLALSQVGSANASYVRWIYVGAGVTSRSWTTTLPTPGGLYEVRLYLNNGYTIAARSSAITVTVPVSASTAPHGGSITGTPSTSPEPATRDWPALSALWSADGRPVAAKDPASLPMSRGPHDARPHLRVHWTIWSRQPALMVDLPDPITVGGEPSGQPMGSEAQPRRTARAV